MDSETLKVNLNFTPECSLCASDKHISAECPTREKKFCYTCGYKHDPKWCLDLSCNRCKRAGHLYEQCTNKFVNGILCCVCFEFGHDSDDCPLSEFPGGFFSKVRCFSCLRFGHVICRSNNYTDNILSRNTFKNPEITSKVEAELDISKEFSSLSFKNKEPKNKTFSRFSKLNPHLQCCVCGREGHFEKDCTGERMDETIASLGEAATKYDHCQNCGIRGHTQNLCPNYESQKAVPPNDFFFDAKKILEWVSRQEREKREKSFAIQWEQNRAQTSFQHTKLRSKNSETSQGKKLLPPSLGNFSGEFSEFISRKQRDFSAVQREIPKANSLNNYRDLNNRSLPADFQIQPVFYYPNQRMAGAFPPETLAPIYTVGIQNVAPYNQSGRFNFPNNANGFYQPGNRRGSPRVLRINQEPVQEGPILNYDHRNAKSRGNHFEQNFGIRGQRDVDLKIEDLKKFPGSFRGDRTSRKRR